MSLEQIYVTGKHKLMFSIILMENVMEDLSQSVFKKHILPVQIRWPTLISPNLSPLCTTINPRNNAKGNERRTQSSEKKEVDWTCKRNREMSCLTNPYPTGGSPSQSPPNPNLTIDDIGSCIPPLRLTGVQPTPPDGLTAPARGILPPQAPGPGVLLIPTGQEIPSPT